MSFLRVRNYQQKCGDPNCVDLDPAHVNNAHKPFPEYFMNLQQIVDFRFASEATDGAAVLGTVAVAMSAGGWTRLDLSSTMKFKKAFEAGFIGGFFEFTPENWDLQPRETS